MHFYFLVASQYELGNVINRPIWVFLTTLTAAARVGFLPPFVYVMC